MALIKRTGGADFPDKLKALVSGPPKSGKTTLLGTVPNIVIADTEPRANNLASLAHLDIPYVTINSSADLRELLMVLSVDSLRQEAANSLGMPSIDAVAIDTLDTLQKILKRERMTEQRTTQFLRDDWGWMKDEMIKIIEGFTNLPLHVIFTVHLKTQDIGTEKNPQTKVLPGLEGAIASEIAGMVGYSLRSFRKEELDVASGTRYTKYWLQAEGDETYDFLGTRTAGRLPAYIDPDFGTIYQAAMAGRPQPQQSQPIQMPVQTPGTAQIPAQPPVQQPQAVQAPVAPQQQAPQQAPQQTAGPDAGPAQPAPQQPAQPVAQQPQAPTPAPQAEQAPQAPATPQTRAGDTDPVNDVALQHMKKVYDALQVGFPEAKLRQINLGDARTLVKMWAACQADGAEGKLAEGHTAQSEMLDYLEAMGLMPDAQDAAPEAPKQVEPKLGGTIEEAKAWVGDGSDLARVNEAYEFERTNKARGSLMNWLESKGAGAPAPSADTQAQAPGAVQTPVENQPAQQPVQSAPAPVEAQQAPVTPEPTPADVPPTDNQAAQAVQAVQEGLGGVVIDSSVNATALCQECGKQIDDTDIAKLSQTRFQKILCVDHYIAATRA
ncbi:MAG: AAA family ATPase [Nonomuraea sp.]|nr:AAA family ATPase [Nonomuraea sp.]